MLFSAHSRHEFLSQYFDGTSSGIFKKAKRSLSNSFDQLMKRKGKEDADSCTPPTPTLVPSGSCSPRSSLFEVTTGDDVFHLVSLHFHSSCFSKQNDSGSRKDPFKASFPFRYGRRTEPVAVYGERAKSPTGAHPPAIVDAVQLSRRDDQEGTQGIEEQEERRHGRQ